MNFFTKIAASIVLLAASGSIFGQAPKQDQLLNGLKILTWNDKSAGQVTVRLRIHAGAAFDPQGKEGVMHLLGDIVFPNEAAREFFVEDLGGNLNITTTYDNIQITASSKPEEFLTMLETIAAAVSNPQIDKDTTAKVRSALLEKVKGLENDPSYVADESAASRLLGTFPYGRPVMGSRVSVKSIDFADLIDAKQRFLTADNATIAISGNFDRSLALKGLKRYFGSWLKADKKVPSTFRQPDDPAPGMLTVASPQPNAFAIRVAMRGAARSAKDSVVADVYARLLEDRLKARVPAEHAKGVFVRHEPHVQPGMIVIGFTGTKNEAGTANGKMDLSDILPKLLNDPVTDADFSAAKKAVAVARQKTPVEETWLDVDTYKLSSADADRTAADRVTIADLRTYAAQAAKRPMATVLVNTPAK